MAPQSTSAAADVAFAGLGGQASLLAGRQVSSTELVVNALERIDAAQPRLNAFRCVRHEAALTEAEEADRRLAAGDRAPLLGVPVAVKDDMDLAGETTAFGCEGAFEPCSEDGEVARRLRAAGAIIVGKTNPPEIGQWPVTTSPAFGITRNPWAPDRTPGGSSGGSAAAVAAGLVPGAAGSDGAGSVRIPAAWTHLVGIKPQRGRISTWPDAEAFNGLTVIGPLARKVADAALLLDVLAGLHPVDLRTRHNAFVGRLLGGPPLALSRAVEPLLRRRLGRVFRDVDVVLTPTTATAPPPADVLDGLGNWATDQAIVSACPYAWPWNVVGWPAVNVPAGLTPGGLPVGAQLLGPAHSEPRLIALAAQLEAAERWHDRRPPEPPDAGAR